MNGWFMFYLTYNDDSCIVTTVEGLTKTSMN